MPSPLARILIYTNLNRNSRRFGGCTMIRIGFTRFAKSLTVKRKTNAFWVKRLVYFPIKRNDR